MDTVDAYWRALNYLSVGQIYLRDNPLLDQPLAPEHIKARLLGHWGTTPGLNFCFAHLNRIIAERDQDLIYVAGPGHGGPAAVAHAWLEGSYSAIYPQVSRDAEGMRRLFAQFSAPGGIPSHVAPQTPGSIHEGGELGYSLAHAYGAAFDNPDLVVACIVGDGEAETGPLATSWHANKFLDPVRDGAVLPILHLNGYKIANPTVLSRIPFPDLVKLMEGYGYRPIEVGPSHEEMRRALDVAFDEIGVYRDGYSDKLPMIVLRTPKGWTGPDRVDGKQVEGTWRAHQVPLAQVRENPAHLAQLERWMRSYHPEELFDSEGRPTEQVLANVPGKPMSASPHTNPDVAPLDLPDFRAYEAKGTSEPTRVLGRFLRDVIDRNRTTFRLMGPDEVASNRLDAVFEVTGRAWNSGREEYDEHLARGGRVMEVLSEHLCQGWLEGYLLTGRHGLFTSYEAFIHIVDAMFNQHAKWLEASRRIPWRKPVASLNYLLSSHVWRQDHNGFSHQDPGFLDVVVNKKPEVVRVYLPPDANTLLSVADHCLRSRDYVNVIVAGKQPTQTLFTMEEAVRHCTRGAGVLTWASHDDPDVVLACAGDVPTQEVLAATAILRERLPYLKVRVVNVVDLMRLTSEHPHGLSDADYDALFTVDKPVIFNFHGYPWLIHRLAYRRHGHDNLHVRGYIEEGTTTTPFDMCMLNDIDRFHLVMDVIDRVPGLAAAMPELRAEMAEARASARAYTREHGEDPPEIANWSWSST
ncbi:MAG: phosphoketolase family protein [Nonomuraea sp.]|nr:phosphoketolase family protein [Nonomuraea sp.]